MYSKNNNSNQNRHIKRSDTDRNYDLMEKGASDYAVKVGKRKPYETAGKERK